jgi:chromosomal replication initiation ATPase DnaA
MEGQTSSFWDQVKEKIAAKISVPSFETWFKNTTATIDNDWVIIECTNEFQCEWLKARYSELIRQAVCQVLGKEMRIFLAVNGEREQLEQQLEQQFQTPITIREYILSLEKRAGELEERVKRCEQIIDKLLNHRPVH